MENIMSSESCKDWQARRSSALCLHEASHGITKKKQPKVRIVHIFAPEIIKIDHANFRETVQKLTGKRRQHPAAATGGAEEMRHVPRDRVKEELGEGKVWREESSGGSLSGFEDVDGFFEGFSFPFI